MLKEKEITLQNDIHCTNFRYFEFCSLFYFSRDHIGPYVFFFSLTDFKYFLKRKCCTILSSPIFLVGGQLNGLVLIYKALQGLDHILTLESVQPIRSTWEKMLMAPPLGNRERLKFRDAFFQRQCCFFE